MKIALRFLTFLAALAGAFAAAALGGFLLYVETSARPAPTPARADAIVVLTGGAGRIAHGAQLLELGLGRRLLVSGVHPGVPDEDIAAQGAISAANMDCCVDLGRQATSTIGNAREVKAWAAQHGFQRLLLVTAGYHMPRSRFEMSRIAPELSFAPARDREKLPSLRKLGAEYAKWNLAQFAWLFPAITDTVPQLRDHSAAPPGNAAPSASASSD